MRKALSKAVNEGGKHSIQVIEDGEIPVHCNFSVKDPMRPKGCIFQDQNCILSPDVPCDKAGVIYKIQCLKCLETEAPEKSV